MKKILTTYFFFCFTFILFSQTINFKGIIADEEATPVENATVTIEGTDFSQKTDEEGNFVFDEDIPIGKNVVTVTGIGFVTKYFTILVEGNRNIVVEEIRMEFTKNEKRRRWVQEKIRKEEERRMKRDRKKVAGILKKEIVKEEKEKSVVVEKDKLIKEVEKIEKPVSLPIVDDVVETSHLQIKYAKELDVPVSSIFNLELYEFVDKWRGVTFLEGGKTMNGIDDSFFSQKFFQDVFGMRIEDTVKEQYDSKFTDKFTDTDYLREGDLVFFKGSGERSKDIVHVGIFLVNNKFIHSISLKNKNDHNGVKISDIRNPFWKSRLVSGGRRIFNE